MSPDCREQRHLAGAAALGALEGEELKQFQQHMAACPVCHAEFERMRRTLEQAGDAGSIPVPANLGGRILAAGREELAAEARRRRVRGWLLWASGAAAGLLLAVGLGWWAMRPAADSAAGCGCWRFVDGDAGNARCSDAAGSLVPERVAWEKSLSGAPGTFKPLAWKSVIIVGTEPSRRTHRGGGKLLAFDCASGSVRWERELQSGDFQKGKGFPDRCIANGRLFLTDGESCMVLDAMSGADLARIEAPADSRGWAWLTAADGRLYGAGRDGKTVFCMDAASGREIWSCAVAGGSFVPAVAGGKMLVASGGGDMLALDAATGAELWRRDGALPAGKATVHARGGVAMVLSESGGVTAFDAAAGSSLWTRTASGAFASGLAFADSAVYLRGGSLALNISDGRVLWDLADASGSLCAAPTAAGTNVLTLAGKNGGSLATIEGASGRTVGQLADAAKRSCDGAIVAGGRIFTVADGRLLAVACRSKG